MINYNDNNKFYNNNKVNNNFDINKTKIYLQEMQTT